MTPDLQALATTLRRVAAELEVAELPELCAPWHMRA